MLVYLLVVTLTGIMSMPDFSSTHLVPTTVTHSFTLTYSDRVSADVAVQRIRTGWAKALQVSVTAAVYEVCLPAPETLPCAGGPVWIHLAPPLGVGP